MTHIRLGQVERAARYLAQTPKATIRMAVAIFSLTHPETRELRYLHERSLAAIHIINIELAQRERGSQALHLFTGGRQ